MKKLTDPKQRKLKLSSMLDQNSSQQKISLANRQITILNQVPQRFQSVKVMYLSQNFISDITHIAQFPQLKVLSLSYNDIQSFKSIQALGSLNYLQVLNLIGNPISRNLLYYCYVIGICNKTLQKLDNGEVKQGQSNKYKQLRNQISNKFQTLQNNYMLIISLYSSLGSSHQVKSEEIVWQFLYNDCLQIYSQNKKKSVNKQQLFLEAMEDLQTRQIQKIQQLSKSIKQNSEELFHQNQQKQQQEQQQQQQEQEYMRQSLQMKYAGIQKLIMMFHFKMNLGLITLKQFAIENRISIPNIKSSYKHSGFSSLTSHIDKYNVQEQKHTEQEQMMFIIIKKKRQERLLKSKYLEIWKTKYTNLQIQKQTQFLYSKLSQYQQKQQKYNHKIELLQELVEINKNKRASLSHLQSRRSSQQFSNKQNTPNRINSSRIVKQKSLIKLTQQKQKLNNLVMRKLLERSN